jgi:dihydrolipoamide dehydrogenase
MQGVDVRLGAGLTAVHVVEAAGTSASTGVGGGAGRELELTIDGGPDLAADELLVAVGRRPRTDAIGLESVGLEPGKSIEVDDRLRATGIDGDWLYAIGDVNGRALLTHIGKYQARAAADVILGKDATVTIEGPLSPRVTESSAGGSFVGKDATGTCRIVVDERRRVIVGATFTGVEVAESLHAATIAVVAEVPLDRLWHAVPSFPTRSELWLQLLEDYGL